MMQEALYRALHTVPPRTLNEIRPPAGAIVLRCTMAGCTRCAQFETEGRDAYESREFRGLRVRHWDCTDETRRDLVMSAGGGRGPRVRAIGCRPCCSAQGVRAFRLVFPANACSADARRAVHLPARHPHVLAPTLRARERDVELGETAHHDRAAHDAHGGRGRQRDEHEGPSPRAGGVPTARWSARPCRQMSLPRTARAWWRLPAPRPRSGTRRRTRPPPRAISPI